MTDINNIIYQPLETVRDYRLVQTLWFRTKAEFARAVNSCPHGLIMMFRCGDKKTHDIITGINARDKHWHIPAIKKAGATFPCYWIDFNSKFHPKIKKYITGAQYV